MFSGEEPAVLALEDGTLFLGRSIGAPGEAVGEVCFNTSLTGYQEIMTDPSYAGQIVTMTAPQIGNVGINLEDMESDRPHIRGFVMRESSPISSNWRSLESLPHFLKRSGVVAIDGLDTRKLTRILREKGAQRGVISTLDFDPLSLKVKARAWPGLTGMDLTGEVTCAAAYPWSEGVWRLGHGHETPEPAPGRKRVTALDYGMKRNIARNLVSEGCEVTILPATATAREVLDTDPEGIFLSNGPGDPAAVERAIDTIRQLLTVGKPIFGICLGHQMLCLALGGRTEKLKFGHRGGNHPVLNLLTGQVEVTSQNHGFVVREQDLPPEVEVTHRSLFDQTVEGMRHRELPVFSVQYHPEASPGPHDAHYLFRQFTALMGG
ncbi:MAG: glutamine-hydrolyzing carbamoyl-phosphate synthase small subunit [Magnetococcales bacterium]|nr:glutamine-hydrolyzing carbamoyl-phosphate synthase small subunit [Magnetococcales bacterium]